MISLIDIKNKLAKFFYPDGTLITETTDNIVFIYVQNCIERLQLKGCFVEFDGERIMIDKDGNLEKCPACLIC